MQSLNFHFHYKDPHRDLRLNSIMSNKFSDTLLPTTATAPSPRPSRDPWLQIFCVMRAKEALVTLAVNARERALAFTRVSPSSSPYNVLHTQDVGEDAGISPTASPFSLVVHPDDEGHLNDIDIWLLAEEPARIVKEKNLSFLHNFGGVERIAELLKTDLTNGIHGGEEDLRRRHEPCIHCNTPAPAKGFFHFFVKACKNPTIILLLLCSALSIGFESKEEGLKNGWYDGITILVAVFLIVSVSTARNLYHARKLYKQPNQNKVEIEVVRDGQRRDISVSEVVIGDIVCLKPGDQIPADGLLLTDSSLEVDEVLDSRINHLQNPFLFHGGKMIQGHGRMLVVSVGSKTAMGEMMKSVTPDRYETTPLQARLDKVSSYTQNIALLMTILVVLVLFMRYLLGKKDDETGYPEVKGNTTAIRELITAMERIVIKPRGMISILTTTLAVLLVGIPEGLPFFATLCLSYWSKSMMSDKVIIKDLSAFVTMS